MKVVWVNGCFDILHRGHVELFKYAKSLGDYLVVGIDDDKRIKEFKGESRPINKLEDRISLLEAIRYIDKVVSFNIDHELSMNVLQSGASIIVVGSDYRNKKIIGSEHASEVVFFDRMDGYSTTDILEIK